MSKRAADAPPRPDHIPAVVWSDLLPEHQALIWNEMLTLRRRDFVQTLRATNTEWKLLIDACIRREFTALLDRHQGELTAWAGRTPFLRDYHAEWKAFFEQWHISPELLYRHIMRGQRGRRLTPEEYGYVVVHATADEGGVPQTLPGNNDGHLTTWDVLVWLGVQEPLIFFLGEIGNVSATSLEGRMYLPLTYLTMSVRFWPGSDELLDMPTECAHYRVAVAQAARFDYRGQDYGIDNKIVALGDALDGVFALDPTNSVRFMRMSSKTTRDHLLRQFQAFYTHGNPFPLLNVRASPMGKLLDTVEVDYGARVALASQLMPTVQALAAALLKFGLDAPDHPVLLRQGAYDAVEATAMLQRVAALPPVPDQPVPARFVDLYPVARLWAAYSKRSDGMDDLFDSWMALAAPLAPRVEEELVATLERHTNGDVEWWTRIRSGWIHSHVIFPPVLLRELHPGNSVRLLKALPRVASRQRRYDEDCNIITALVARDPELAKACWVWRNNADGQVLFDPMRDDGYLINTLFGRPDEASLQALEAIYSAQVLPLSRLRVIGGSGSSYLYHIPWPDDSTPPVWNRVMRRVLLYLNIVGLASVAEVIGALAELLNTTKQRFRENYLKDELVTPLIAWDHGPALAAMDWSDETLRRIAPVMRQCLAAANLL